MALGQFELRLHEKLLRSIRLSGILEAVFGSDTCNYATKEILDWRSWCQSSSSGDRSNEVQLQLLSL